MGFRRYIFEISENENRHHKASMMYDGFMLISIGISILPLFFRTWCPIFTYTEIATTAIFILDYLLRWTTADYRSKKGKTAAFLLYPITPFAIVDILSILPGLNVLSGSFKLLRISRLFRIFRVFKVFRYSNQFTILVRVLKKERKVLLSVLVMAIFYIVVTALLMFNAEQGSEHFDSFFDAMYWATTTLTTVGYGDIYPVDDLGRAISMLSAIFGVAIIALPSGIITASYLDEIRKHG